MKKILHRVNTINYLKKVPKEFGVEVDIRSFNNKVIISHEPLLNGTSFEEWISFYEHDFLILNIKEEGLEKYVLDILEKYKIKNFFFLDQSFPFLLKTINSGEKRCAIRISEFESIDSAYNLAGRIEWVWIDYFNKFPLNQNDFIGLKKLGYKICIVSPEIQGKENHEIKNLKSFLMKNKIIPDAVCTKDLGLWKSCNLNE